MKKEIMIVRKTNERKYKYSKKKGEKRKYRKGTA